MWSGWHSGPVRKGSIRNYKTIKTLDNREEDVPEYDADFGCYQNQGFDGDPYFLDEIDDGEFTVEALKAKWSQM